MTEPTPSRMSELLHLRRVKEANSRLIQQQIRMIRNRDFVINSKHMALEQIADDLTTVERELLSGKPDTELVLNLLTESLKNAKYGQTVGVTLETQGAE